MYHSERDHMARRDETIHSPAFFRRSLSSPDLINYWTKVASQVIRNQLFVSCEYNGINRDSISGIPYHAMKILKLLTEEKK